MLVDVLLLLARCTQIFALAATLGGTVFVWFRSRRRPGQDPVAYRRRLLWLAEKYERWFWLALGALLLAGFGGLRVPAGAEPWLGLGWRLLLAALGGLVFVALAGARTLVILLLSQAGDNASPRALRLFPHLYGGTGVALVAVVVLALAAARVVMTGSGA